jgi:octaprenyl-diphosphate synthase
MTLGTIATPPTLNLKDIFSPIQADMVTLDEVIRERLASKVVLIDQISSYIIQAGGKRVRPALLFLISQALANGKTVAHSHELAAVIEFIHTSTLLHDDVVDESDLRRGRQTANAVFGNAASVLVGDFLYSRAFQMMVAPGILKVMEILAEATNTIAEGEVLQLLNMHDPDVDEARYLEVILFKTAKLFEASTELGALIAGASTEQIEAAANYGKHIGLAFQVMDDWLDYTADAAQMGKNAGDDLREGKPTLPLIYLLNHGTPAQSALAKHAIEREEELTEEFFNEVLEAVRSSGALDYTLEFAKKEAEKARACLAAFPANVATNSLADLCDYSLKRTT